VNKEKCILKVQAEMYVGLCENGRYFLCVILIKMRYIKNLLYYEPEEMSNNANFM
jgi:hypothetical protein